MKKNDWVAFYLKECKRLGHMTEEAAAQYTVDGTTEKLMRLFPEDPDGAAIYMRRFAGKVMPEP